MHAHVLALHTEGESSRHASNAFTAVASGVAALLRAGWRAMRRVLLDRHGDRRMPRPRREFEADSCLLGFGGDPANCL